MEDRMDGGSPLGRRSTPKLLFVTSACMNWWCKGALVCTHSTYRQEMKLTVREYKRLHVISYSAHEYRVQLSLTSNPTTLLGPTADWTSALLLGCSDSDVGRQGSAGCCPGE